MAQNCKSTMYACFAGYIVQAIVNNFAPLLFVTFQTTYGIPLSQITLLITINFVLQLVIDSVSAWFIKLIGYRMAAIVSHASAIVGLILMTILPEVLPNPFVGLLIAVFFYAIGGGLLEVIISPMIEACPTENKEKAMSMLHSFYCWGHVGVVLISTLFFTLFGIQNWRILSWLWTLLPIANLIVFTRVPIYTLEGDGESGLGLREIFSQRIFWIFMLMMVCSGASEQAVSQWASTFAEEGLQVSKAVGDLAGPMAFAAMMGISRMLYGKFGDRMNLNRFIQFSCLLCMASYLCISLVPNPVIGLLGCAVCGFAVGILWPGTYSIASAALKGGGTLMFALLALAGDLGCTSGPTIAGFVSSCFDNDLRAGILAAIIFPTLMLLGTVLLTRQLHKTAK